MITAIFETEQSADKASDPIWASASTAAMATINLMAGPDDYKHHPERLDSKIDAAVTHLLGTPANLRWLNLGGWFGKYEFSTTNWGGVDYPQPHNPPIDAMLTTSEYIVGRMLSRGLDSLVGVFIDNEGQAIKADGTHEMYEQANRMAWLRKASQPFSDAFACVRLNYACGSPHPKAHTTAWYGGPLSRGTIDGTSSVDCYSLNLPNKTWGIKRRNVQACVDAGPTIAHHPPLIMYHGTQMATPAQAAADLNDAILVDSAAGVDTHFAAAYMWPPEHWPLMAHTVQRAVASANRLRNADVQMESA